MTNSPPDIVAIGASAGGLEALEKLLLQLPPDLSAAIVVVLHRPVDRTSYLAEILARLIKMPVVMPKEGEHLRHGTCYIGLPDRHLTVGPNANAHLLPDGFYRGHCIDALFQSLARHAGKRTIAVILSGMLKDGSLGLTAIKEAGGIALVQSPEDAAFPDMPRNAIIYNETIDFIGPIDAIAEQIRRRVGEAQPNRSDVQTSSPAAERTITPPNGTLI
jgi:two-component system, chemotaxis family, protein-glutamate methylesterase/glutaminase